MGRISNKDLKQILPVWEDWWNARTQEEKDWYLRFWATCSNK